MLSACVLLTIETIATIRDLLLSYRDISLLSSGRATGSDANSTQIRDWILSQKRWAGIFGVYNFTDGSQRGLGELNVLMFRYDPTKPEFLGHCEQARWIQVMKVDSVERKRMLALATGMLAAAPRVAGAQAAALPIRFATAPIEEAMLPYYAQEKGFFRAAGLNVELEVFPNGGSVTQGVLAGAVDVGVTNSGSLALAHTRGIPLYLLACGATYSRSSPIAHLVVSKSFAFKSARDLSGKSIAVSPSRI
jgi:hypothetical protein